MLPACLHWRLIAAAPCRLLSLALTVRALCVPLFVTSLQRHWTRARPVTFSPSRRHQVSQPPRPRPRPGEIPAAVTLA